MTCPGESPRERGKKQVESNRERTDLAGPDHPDTADNEIVRQRVEKLLRLRGEEGYDPYVVEKWEICSNDTPFICLIAASCHFDE